MIIYLKRYKLWLSVLLVIYVSTYTTGISQPAPDVESVTITIVVDDIEDVHRSALDMYSIISTQIVNLESTLLPYRFGFMLRDADGHAVLVVQN